MQARWRIELAGGVIATLLVVMGLATLFFSRHLDRSFITYRVVQNLLEGRGPAYNPGQPAALHDAVSPFYALLLSLLARLWPDLPALGNLVSATGVAVGGLALGALVVRAGDATPARASALLAALLYVTSPLFWAAPGLDFHWWMAACLLAVWCYVQAWAVPAALVAALAVLIRPEAGVLVVVLLADWIAGGRPVKPAPIMIFVVLVGLGWIGLYAAYGGIGLLLGALDPPLLPADAAGWNVFEGLAALVVALASGSPLWLIFPALAIPGLIALRSQRWALLLVGWAALHILTLALLRVAVYAWSVATIIPALTALVALGTIRVAGQIEAQSPAWALAGLMALLALAPTADSLVDLALERDAPHDALHPILADPGSQQAGVWLRENLSPDAWVGVTGSAGMLGYESQRLIQDMAARLQPPDPSIDLVPGDVFSWLVHTQPDALVLRQSEAESRNGADLANDPWFSSAYVEVARFTPADQPDDPILIYRRTADPPAMTGVLSGMVEVSPSLTLNRIATDFSLDPLEGGRRGLLRLEWLAGPSMVGTQYVAIRIQGRDGSVVGLGGRDLDFTGWPSRRLVTSYHWIDLAPAPAPGVYNIELGLGSDPFNLTWHAVAQAKVPFGGEVFVGGFSGARAAFGDVALTGYRINRTDGGLDVLLLWEAISAPLVDYRILVQVRDASGTIVMQVETEPYSGAYPTSIWSSGEQVPDTIHIDAVGLPPGDYEVLIGLVAPDGTRLLTEEGQESVLVGRVSLSPD